MIQPPVDLRLVRQMPGTDRFGNLLERFQMPEGVPIAEFVIGDNVPAAAKELGEVFVHPRT